MKYLHPYPYGDIGMPNGRGDIGRPNDRTPNRGTIGDGLEKQEEQNIKGQLLPLLNNFCVKTIDDGKLIFILSKYTYSLQI